MMYLKDMEDKEALAVVLKNETLSRKFSDFIYESEIEFRIFDEVLSCFERGTINYEIGIYNHNYLRVNDESGFLDGIGEFIKCYGGSDKVRHLYNACQKLRYNNLFSHMVGRLCEAFFEDEIEGQIGYVEDLNQAIYEKDEDSEDLLGWMPEFLDIKGDEFFLDEDGCIYKAPQKIK